MYRRTFVVPNYHWMCHYIFQKVRCSEKSTFRLLSIRNCKNVVTPHAVVDLPLNTVQYNTIQYNTIQYLLTPWSRVLLDKLTVNFAASQEIPCIYGSRKFLNTIQYSTFNSVFSLHFWRCVTSWTVPFKCFSGKDLLKFSMFAGISSREANVFGEMNLGMVSFFY
jgi:hypothetical protein